MYNFECKGCGSILKNLSKKPNKCDACGEDKLFCIDDGSLKFTIYDSDEEAEKAKREFLEKMNLGGEEGDIKDYTSLEINWDCDVKSWEKAKERANNLISQSTEKDKRLIFIGSTKDKIEGKPQLIHQTIQRIPLVRRCMEVVRTKGEDTQYNYSNQFIDDKYDKRRLQELYSLAFDFWVYRVISKGKEHYVFSREKLTEEYSEISGMQIDLDDQSDMSGTLSIKKISSIFILHEAHPKVKALNPTDLINHVKELEWTSENFKDYFFMHPDGRIFDYTEDFNMLRISQMLSSKYEGYPLHLMKMGPVGTGKTTEAEVLNFKFQEEKGILEAANSTLKALVPSFKEKPANLGYICGCNRIAIIDELMKMVEQAMFKAHDNQRVSNYFGQMNMLLEHKKRTVGSGNDNSAVVVSSAKVCVTTNNITGKDTIYQHLTSVDATTMSRYLPWVQDNEEIEKIYNNEGIRNFRTNIQQPANISHTGPHTPTTIPIVLSLCDNEKDPFYDRIQELSDSFLTIYDSCQQFLVRFDENKCKEIFETIKNLAKEPMKQVWRARGLHHTILILDGITKFRCLFRDFDETFQTKPEDYEVVERILRHMVKGWDTKMVPVSFEGGFL